MCSRRIDVELEIARLMFVEESKAQQQNGKNRSGGEVYAYWKWHGQGFD